MALLRANKKTRQGRSQGGFLQVLEQSFLQLVDDALDMPV